MRPFEYSMAVFFGVYGARSAFFLALMLLGVLPLSVRFVARSGCLARAAALVFSMSPLRGSAGCAPCGVHRSFLRQYCISR